MIINNHTNGDANNAGANSAPRLVRLEAELFQRSDEDYNPEPAPRRGVPPEEMFFFPELSGNAVKLYLVLRAGLVPSITTLSSMGCAIGNGERSVPGYLRELQNAGLIRFVATGQGINWLVLQRAAVKINTHQTAQHYLGKLIEKQKARTEDTNRIDTRIEKMRTIEELTRPPVWRDEEWETTPVVVPAGV